MIVEVNPQNLHTAAVTHSASWRDAHKAFCSPEFIALHGVAHQTEYLRSELRAGKQVYMLLAPEPVGIVSVHDSLIENLYVHPRVQRSGYGTQLLQFAVAQCKTRPRLWLPDNNKPAYALYKKNGFQPTGNVRRLSDTISELEMQL